MAGSKKDDSYSLVAIIACALPLVLFCTSDSGAAPGAGLVLVADGYAPLADADKDGSLNATELLNFVAAFGKDHNLGSGSAVGFSALDKDSSGRLDAAEFGAMMQHVNALITAKRAEIAQLESAIQQRMQVQVNVTVGR